MLSSQNSSREAEMIRAVAIGGIRNCAELAEAENPSIPRIFDEMNDVLSAVTGLLVSRLRLKVEHDRIIAELHEAGMCVGLLAFESTPAAAQKAADILTQILTDILQRLPAPVRQQTLDSEHFRAIVASR